MVGLLLPPPQRNLVYESLPEELFHSCKSDSELPTHQRFVRVFPFFLVRHISLIVLVVTGTTPFIESHRILNFSFVCFPVLHTPHCSFPLSSTTETTWCRPVDINKIPGSPQILSTIRPTTALATITEYNLSNLPTSSVDDPTMSSSKPLSIISEPDFYPFPRLGSILNLGFGRRKNGLTYSTRLPHYFSSKFLLKVLGPYRLCVYIHSPKVNKSPTQPLPQLS